MIKDEEKSVYFLHLSQICELSGKDIKIIYYTKDCLFGYSPENEEFWIKKSEIAHILDPPLKKQLHLQGLPIIFGKCLELK